MATKPRMSDAQMREQRQRDYSASETLSSRYPKIKEVVFDLRFTYAADVPLLSPYRQIFTSDMQAFFDLRCPSKICAGGGFDLDHVVKDAARSPEKVFSGQLACGGVNTEGDARGKSCDVRVNFRVESVPITSR